MTQTKCQNCSAKTADAYLCPRCINRLRDTLAELPWWLARLTETAVGQTRMGDNGGRKSARHDELHGDDHPIAVLPEAKTLQQARIERQRRVLASALAAGGCNARASELLAEIADSLGYWVRVLCEARGVEAPALTGGRDYGVPLVAWMHQNVQAVALSEDAGDIMGEVLMHRRDVERAVNRPVRWWDLGPCPGWLDSEDRECGNHLRVMEGTDVVRCRECSTRHNVHRLMLVQKSSVEAEPMTRAQMLRYNKTLPHEFQVPLRTLQDWFARGRLKSCESNESGDPLYLWIDVQLLMIQRPQKGATGATLHKPALVG